MNPGNVKKILLIIFVVTMSLLLVTDVIARGRGSHSAGSRGGSSSSGGGGNNRESSAFDTRTRTFSPTSRLSNVSYNMVGPLSGYSVPSNNRLGGGSNRGGNTQVFVLPPLAPTPVINLTQSIINLGNSTTVIWSASGASSCSGQGFFTGGATSGQVTVTPTYTTTYTVQCTWSGNYRNNGLSSSSGTVTVLNPILSISATPSLLQSGSTSVITWTATAVNSCAVSENNTTIIDSWSGTSGTQTTSPITEETIYTLTCVTDGGQVPESVTVRLVPVFQEF